MGSSISRFKQRLPACAPRCFSSPPWPPGAGIFYSVKINPEIHYYVQGAEIKDRWADQMTREHGFEIIVYGGSSVAPSRLTASGCWKRFGLATVNYGRGAGMGAAVFY